MRTARTVRQLSVHSLFKLCVRTDGCLAHICHTLAVIAHQSVDTFGGQRQHKCLNETHICYSIDSYFETIIENKIEKQK